MSLFMRCIETYDNMSHLVGKNIEGKQTLAPIGHIITTAKIEITINEKGEFVRANNIDEKVVVPCTKQSASRTSKPVAHPLCDQLAFVSTNYSEEKNNLYLESLQNWVESKYTCDILQAIYKYVSQNNVYEDIVSNNIKIKNEKDFVVWRIEGFSKGNGLVCENREIQELYVQYYLSNLDGPIDLCMATYQHDILIEGQYHLKGVVPLYGNAKLISSNDKDGFTFRGRLNDANEACSVSYIASQKAHNVLNWIVANEYIYLGNRICVAWNPKGNRIPKLDIPIPCFEDDESVTFEGYRNKLRQVVFNLSNDNLKDEFVVTAMLEAATNGRLSVTYYNELPGVTFLEKLGKWDEETAFSNRYNKVRVPKLFKYALFSYGTYRSETDKFDIDDKIKTQLMQRLVICRLDGKAFPLDVMRKLVDSASKLQLYSSNTRENLLHTTCSAIRKYSLDNLGEEISMNLERDKQNRSYQFGRLLAILEKAERDTYEKDNEGRETNAIRMQSAYVQRPMKVCEQIISKVKQGYYQKLNEGQKSYYEKLIEEIMTTIAASVANEEELNRPLEEIYIVGYYLQKQDLYTSKEKKEKEA